MSYYNPGSILHAHYKETSTQDILADTRTLLKINGLHLTTFDKVKERSLWDVNNSRILPTNDGYDYTYLARVSFKIAPQALVLKNKSKLITNLRSSKFFFEVSISEVVGLIYAKTDTLTPTTEQMQAYVFPYFGNSMSNPLFLNEGASVYVTCEEAVTISSAAIYITRQFIQ